MVVMAFCPLLGHRSRDARSMFYAHWGLAHSPFVGGDAPLFYQGESQNEALARLRFVADQRRHAVLLGERGVGKSLLLARFTEHWLRQGRRAAYASAAGVTPRELLWRIAAGLSLSPQPEEDAWRLVRRLEDAATGGSDCAAVVLLDDVDQAGADVRSQLYRLIGIGAAEPWLTFVLAATPTSCFRLGEELLDVLDLRIDLDPWNESDMTGYIQHALVEAGGDRPLFDDEALAALYALTDGAPRKVNRLADHALLGAAAEGLEMVDAAMIEAAHDALNWSVTTS